jgi:hypothetical protein
MGGEASMALFGLYSTVGAAGIGMAVLFRKEPRILDSPRRVLTATFLVRQRFLEMKK